MKALALYNDDYSVYVSKWDIGANGAHTKVSGIPGTGFSGVARTAAGKYTITFQPGVPVGGLVDLIVTHWPAVDAANLNPRPSKAGFTAETAAASATMLYETWDNDTTAQTELSSGDQVTITAVFLKSKVS